MSEIERLREALNAAVGYLLNAKIDLGTGCTKATAIRTIEGGIAMARAALAATPTAERGEWKPIESAPRTGINFLACSPGSSVFYAHWANGVVDSSDYSECGGYPERHATHWMPLPAAPALSSGEQTS